MAAGEPPDSCEGHATARPGPANEAHVRQEEVQAKDQQAVTATAESPALSGAGGAARSRGIRGAERKARVALASMRLLSCQGRTARPTREPERCAV